MIFVRGDIVILEYAVGPTYSNVEAVRSSPVWNRAHTKWMSTNSHNRPGVPSGDIRVRARHRPRSQPSQW
jgi:hypothetical protein